MVKNALLGKQTQLWLVQLEAGRPDSLLLRWPVTIAFGNDLASLALLADLTAINLGY